MSKAWYVRQGGPYRLDSGQSAGLVERRHNHLTWELFAKQLDAEVSNGAVSVFLSCARCSTRISAWMDCKELISAEPANRTWIASSFSWRSLDTNGGEFLCGAQVSRGVAGPTLQFGNGSSRS